jgi:hypothetical protein
MNKLKNRNGTVTVYKILFSMVKRISVLLKPKK